MIQNARHEQEPTIEHLVVQLRQASSDYAVYFPGVNEPMQRDLLAAAERLSALTALAKAVDGCGLFIRTMDRFPGTVEVFCGDEGVICSACTYQKMWPAIRTLLGKTG